MTPKRKRRPAESASSRVGADEALTTLVGQFADPLVFLRELVQNSLDAGSTQIDVEFAWEPDDAGKRKGKNQDREGLMTITVADNGEGMNEHIIDNHLLTLFSSTKENDLTKIGKFGVGFVSIFAIEPDLVVLDTGQAGESWRILFHPDRTFEKLRRDVPVEGTTVALHKRVSEAQLRDLRGRGADTVRYWCKYAEADIAVDGEAIAESFGLDAALRVEHREPGTEIVLGFAPMADEPSEGWTRMHGDGAHFTLAPLVGFYNRGLTLVEGSFLPDEGNADLAGLSLRVKSRYLEHTLTRDNVRQDESYDKAIAIVRRLVRESLAPRLRAHLEALAAFRAGGVDAPDPGAPSLAVALLYARLPCMELARRDPDAAILPTVDGDTVSLRALDAQDTPFEGIPLAAKSTPLTKALAARGIDVVLDTGATGDHLIACGRRPTPAHAGFYTATPVEPDETDRALLDAVAAHLDRARARIEEVVLGDFDYPHSAVAGRVHVRQERAFALTQIGESDAPTLFGGARTVVLGAAHPLVEACRALAVERPALAAHLLAQAVCAGEEVPVDRREAIAAAALAQHRTRAAGESGA